MEQMVADLKAASASQSSQGSAEEGEEEEAQADDSDNEQADPKPVYAEGNPLELLHRGVAHEAPNAAEVEEGADAESQKTAPAVTEVLEEI